MDLGNFSLSLAVKDLAASRAFYETLGFTVFHGDEAHGFLILQSPGQKATIGLFQGMFEKNMLTFNPGWDASAQPTDSFDDVRAIQARLKDAGIEFLSEVDPDGAGPGSCMVVDPDGNPVLIDQHV